MVYGTGAQGQARRRLVPLAREACKRMLRHFVNRNVRRRCETRASPSDTRNYDEEDDSRTRPPRDAQASVARALREVPNVHALPRKRAWTRRGVLVTVAQLRVRERAGGRQGRFRYAAARVFEIAGGP